LATFPLAVLAPGVLIILLGALAVPPPHAAAIRRLLMGLLAFTIVVVAAFAVTYVVALSIAAYQWYRLRRDPAHARAQIAAIHPEAPGSAHEQRLRRVAAELKKCLDSDEAPRYGTGGVEDTRLWRNAFREHFPELWPLLDALDHDRAAMSSDVCQVLKDAVTRQLEAIAVTENFASRCQFCQ
jgi:hypothetical protein